MLYVGIDTGEHTGMAVWDSESETFLVLATLPLYSALLEVERLRTDNDITIVFEDARQRKWIPRERNVSEYRGRLMGAGSVKRDATIWEEYCKGMGIPYEAVPPRKGATKWSPQTFAAVTGWKLRTSNHARDAALLVFGR